ncbi:metallophosphoesterase family protein [Liquorilactobacillus sicerae]|uniref:metallophosphoesterase family protein n=1 Tax=Liquorilactobacillus sicerae TaxID=1416943 RepID=UPI002480BE33
MKINHIVQISDLHLAPKNGIFPFNQQIDPFKKLEMVFADLERLPQKPEMIVLTGDLIHEGMAEDYERLHEFLYKKEEDLGTDINVLLGNHDRAGAFYLGYCGLAPKSQFYYRQRTKDFDYYFLDSNFQNIEQGYLPAAELKWLELKLQEDKERPSLIFLHHPVAGASLAKMRFSVLQNDQVLLQLATSANVRGIFSGHIHFATTEMIYGILCATAESTAYHIDCTALHDHLVADACGYNLISFDENLIGVENRMLLAPQKTVMHIPVGETDYVDPKIFTSRTMA